MRKEQGLYSSHYGEGRRGVHRIRRAWLVLLNESRERMLLFSVNTLQNKIYFRQRTSLRQQKNSRTQIDQK